MNTTKDIPDLLARGFKRAPTSYREDCLVEAFRAAGAFVGRGPFRHAHIVREEVPATAFEAAHSTFHLYTLHELEVRDPAEYASWLANLHGEAT